MTDKLNTNQIKIVRKKYTAQFKDQVMERIARDGVPQVSKDLGIADCLLYSRRAKHQLGGNTLENQKLQQAKFA